MEESVSTGAASAYGNIWSLRAKTSSPCCPEHEELLSCWRVRVELAAQRQVVPAHAALPELRPVLSSRS
jgi:hypothetical protein